MLADWAEYSLIIDKFIQDLSSDPVNEERLIDLHELFANSENKLVENSHCPQKSMRPFLTK